LSFCDTGDHQRIDRRLDDVEQHDVGLFERDDEAVGIGRFEMVDRFIILGGGADSPVALERRLDVGRRHFLAIVELDALAQLERVGLEILRGGGFRRQHGTGCVVGVERHEAFEQIVDDLEFDGA